MRKKEACPTQGSGTQAQVLAGQTPSEVVSRQLSMAPTHSCSPAYGDAKSALLDIPFSS